jgi:hypothetical protein
MFHTIARDGGKSDKKIYMQCSETCFKLFHLTPNGVEKAMTERTRLERAALDAHRRGDDWADFWKLHRDSISAAEPWNRDAYHRLVRRLSYLVTCGDCDGMMAAGDNWPPEADDPPQYPASDNRTQARINWDAIGVAPVNIGIVPPGHEHFEKTPQKQEINRKRAANSDAKSLT